MLEIPDDAVSAWDKFKEQVKERDKKFMEEYREIATDALVAQRSEQDAHNVLVTGSNPVEGTTSMQRKLEIYEQCLRGIDSIKSVSTGETSDDFGMSMKLFSAMSQIKKLVRKALEEGEKL